MQQVGEEYRTSNALGHREPVPDRFADLDAGAVAPAACATARCSPPTHRTARAAAGPDRLSGLPEPLAAERDRGADPS